MSITQPSEQKHEALILHTVLPTCGDYAGHRGEAGWGEVGQGRTDQRQTDRHTWGRGETETDEESVFHSSHASCEW